MAVILLRIVRIGHWFVTTHRDNISKVECIPLNYDPAPPPDLGVVD